MASTPSITIEACFYKGDRVKVIKQSSYRNKNLIGLIGTVAYDGTVNIAVKLDNIDNTRSQYSVFYIKPHELRLVAETAIKVNETMEENTMKTITNYLNIATVRMLNSDNATYYYANYDPELAVGDICVTISARRFKYDSVPKTGFMTAEVIAIDDASAHDVTGEVVSRVDISEYNDRVQSRIKAAELKEKMEARAKQLQDIALYQMLAKDDPDMAALLAEYQGLNHK